MMIPRWLLTFLRHGQISVVVAVALLGKCCLASADMQWLFYSGEQIVALGSLVTCLTQERHKSACAYVQSNAAKTQISQYIYVQCDQSLCFIMIGYCLLQWTLITTTAFVPKGIAHVGRYIFSPFYWSHIQLRWITCLFAVCNFDDNCSDDCDEVCPSFCWSTEWESMGK